jgi:hypothetical protein
MADLTESTTLSEAVNMFIYNFPLNKTKTTYQ